MRQVKAEGGEVGGGMRGGEVVVQPRTGKSHLPDEFSSSNSTCLELPHVAKSLFFSSLRPRFFFLLRARVLNSAAGCSLMPRQAAQEKPRHTMSRSESQRMRPI